MTEALNRNSPLSSSFPTESSCRPVSRYPGLLVSHSFIFTIKKKSPSPPLRKGVQTKSKSKAEIPPAPFEKGGEIESKIESKIKSKIKVKVEIENKSGIISVFFEEGEGEYWI